MKRMNQKKKNQKKKKKATKHKNTLKAGNRLILITGNYYVFNLIIIFKFRYCDKFFFFSQKSFESNLQFY